MRIYSRAELEKLTEINYAHEFTVQEILGHRFITIDNFLKNPKIKNFSFYDKFNFIKRKLKPTISYYSKNKESKKYEDLYFGKNFIYYLETFCLEKIEKLIKEKEAKKNCE